MDIAKQYPQLPHAPEDSAVFEIEDLLARLGLSLVDLMQLSRTCNKQSADALGARAGVPGEQILSMLRRARRVFCRALVPQKPLALLRPRIRTGLPPLDHCLLGGLAPGHVTEVFGASGSGKSQLMLFLAVQALAGEPQSSTCVYVSTELPLESRRLRDFGARVPGALARVSYIYCPDLETQDHIVFTQLRAKLEAERAGGRRTRAVFVDSVGHHLRAADAHLNTLLFLRSHVAWQEAALAAVPGYPQHKAARAAATNQFLKGDARFRGRTSKQLYLYSTYAHLAGLAREYGVAVVLANQVSDVVDEHAGGKLGGARTDPLDYDFQAGAFLGHAPVSAPAGVIARRQAPEARKRRCVGLRSTAVTAVPTIPAVPAIPASLAGLEGHAMSGLVHKPTDEPVDECVQQQQPRRMVPALGYTWSKLVAQRILVWKSYRPADHAGAARDNAPADNPASHVGPPPELLLYPYPEAFQVHRYARAVLALALGAATAGFEIRQAGVAPVT